MGCSGPKSLIQLSADGQTFLDKLLRHINVRIIQCPVLLNSFNTEQTRRIFQQFTQRCLAYRKQAFKKIDAHSRLPLDSNLANALTLAGVFILIYIILVFYSNMDDGIDYLFISNADNLRHG